MSDRTTDVATNAAIDPVITVQGVSKRFCRDLRRSLRYGVQDIVREVWPWSADSNRLRPGEFWGLRDVTFELQAGESLAIVGRNGAGKTTMLKLLNGLLKPDAGRITVRGKTAALIELGSGFNQVLSGRENVFANAAVMGMSRGEVEDALEDIIDFSGIREFIDSPLQFYSKGMTMRLAFSVAVHLEPAVMLLDEVLAVGDAAFQRKCVRHVAQYLERGGVVILVGHNPYLAQVVCRRGLLLEQGRMLYAGALDETMDQYVQLLRDDVPLSSTVGVDGEDASATQTVGRDFATHRRGGAPPLSNERTNDGYQPGQVSSADSPVIDDLTIRPLSGDVLRRGDEVLIVMRYRSLARIDDVRWGFMLFTADGWVCMSAAVSTFSFCVEPGCGEVSARVRLPFLGGNYIAKGALVEGEFLRTIALTGWHDTPRLFTVVDTPDKALTAISHHHPLIAVEVAWNAPEVGDASRAASRAIERPANSLPARMHART